MKTRYITLGALVAAASCLPNIRRLSAFSSRFADNDRTQIAAVAAQIPSAEPPSQARNALHTPLIAAVIQGQNRAVALFDMAAFRQLWTTPLAASSPPQILGDLVVVAEGERVVALDLRTGQRRWTHPTRQLPFIGAARDGDTVVIVSSVGGQGGAARVGRVDGLDAQGGGQRWHHDVVGVLGRPAADAGFAFIPWDRQSVAVLDLASGVERARVHTTDNVLAWVFAAPQGVFYGSNGLYRFTPRSAAGTRAGSDYAPNPLQPDARETVPGNPTLYADAFVSPTGTATARDRIRYAFEPSVGERGGVAVMHDTIYLSYYRYIVAVDAHSGEVRWARAVGPDESAAGDDGGNEAARRAQASLSNYDIVHLAVTPTALVAVGGNGRVRAFEPRTGAVIGTADLAASVGAITADLGGFRPPTAGAAPAPEGNVREQLVNVIRDPDNRLVPMRAYLVRMLTRREEPEVTRDLLDLYRQRSIPGSLRQEIATALRARRNGAEFLIQALSGEQAHYDYLENRQAPPLDVIAPTLASMHAREAVPVLLQHLFDHETPINALPAVITAIADLSDASVIPQLRAFVQRYRADTAFADDKNVPLQTAAAAIFRLGDAASRTWLTALSQDAAAHAPLRQSIRRLFEDERTTGQGRTREQQLAAAREALEGRVNALRAAVAAFPRALSQDAFDAEWANHIDDVRACATAAVARRPGLNEIRVTLTLRSETPSTLFATTPPPPRLSGQPTFEQQLAGVAEQSAWVDTQIAQLQAHHALVRTTAYSPQDPELVRCMDTVLRPLEFPGFGRGISTRTITQSISTVRARAVANASPGFGTPPGAQVLVPWFLISSPSLDAANNRLIEPAAAPPTGPTRGTPTEPAVGTSGPATSTGPAASPASRGDAGAPAAPAGGRPWWEEQ